MAISVSDAVSLVSGTNDPFTTASFDPGAADALLVACCMFNSAAGATPTLTMSNPAGSAITWTSQGKRGAADGGRSGVAEIFTAPVTGGSGARTVRCATNAAASDDAGGLKVFVVTGHDTSSPIGAVGEGSDTVNDITPTVLTSTAAGAEVFVAASEWNSLGAPTSTDLAAPPTRGEAYDNADVAGIALRKTAATSGASITANLNAGGTGAAEWNWVAVEIKPAAGGTDLTVQDAGQGHTADNVTLTQVHVLAVADATHGHTADNVVLQSGAVDLVVADAGHGHTADAPTLTQDHTLATADAAHSHTVDNLALTQVHILAAADAGHAQTAESVALTQVHQLVVQDALHTHTADSPTLNLAGTLTVQDAGHSHTADTVVLTQVHLLAVDGATHAQMAESLALAQLHLLAVADTLHTHLADTVLLGGPEEPTGDRLTTAGASVRQHTATGTRERQTAAAGRSTTSSARGRL